MVIDKEKERKGRERDRQTYRQRRGKNEIMCVWGGGGGREENADIQRDSEFDGHNSQI